MLLFQPLGEAFERLRSGFQNNLITGGQGPDIGQSQVLVQEPTESGLRIPVIKGHGEAQVRVVTHPVFKKLFSYAQFTGIQFRYPRALLIAPPYAKQVLAPFLGIIPLQLVLAGPEFNIRSDQTSFQIVHVRGLPQAIVDRIIGLVIAVMHTDQVVRPPMTIVNVIP